MDDASHRHRHCRNGGPASMAGMSASEAFSRIIRSGGACEEITDATTSASAEPHDLAVLARLLQHRRMRSARSRQYLTGHVKRRSHDPRSGAPDGPSAGLCWNSPDQRPSPGGSWRRTLRNGQSSKWPHPGTSLELPKASVRPGDFMPSRIVEKNGYLSRRSSSSRRGTLAMSLRPAA